MSTNRFTRACPYCASPNVIGDEAGRKAGGIFHCDACRLPLPRYLLLDTETGRPVAQVWCCRHPSRSRRWVKASVVRCELCGHKSTGPYAGNKMDERNDVEWLARVEVGVVFDEREK